MRFSKMHGIGNDFVVFDDRNGEIEAKISYNELSKRLCDRHFGIGADGLIVVLNSETHDIRYRIFNPDGSEPEMCGNGIRCYAKFVYDNRILDEIEFKVETLAGTIIPKLNINEKGIVETVTVNMGAPIIKAAQVPFVSKNESAISETLTIDGTTVDITAVSMGNPHAITFVKNAEEAPVNSFGPKVEIFESFPEKTNVEFVSVRSRNEMDMRVWERGAGETLACGTGACASVVAANLNGLVDEKAVVHLKGGDLDIRWDKEKNLIFMTGAAELVFEGEIEI